MSAILTVGALIYTVLAWKNSYWGIAGRLYYTLVTAAAVSFVWFLNSWNACSDVQMSNTRQPSSAGPAT